MERDLGAIVDVDEDRDVEELLDPAGDFGDHLRAGNQIFSAGDASSI